MKVRRDTPAPLIICWAGPLIGIQRDDRLLTRDQAPGARVLRPGGLEGSFRRPVPERTLRGFASGVPGIHPSLPSAGGAPSNSYGAPLSGRWLGAHPISGISGLFEGL